MVRKLNNIGINSFAQIAAWTDDDIKTIDQQFGLRGRITREDWVGQAQRLSEGTEAL
jgi:predicted flap endonuclease-1-like 5' DNA nuclease